MSDDHDAHLGKGEYVLSLASVKKYTASLDAVVNLANRAANRAWIEARIKHYEDVIADLRQKLEGMDGEAS